MTRRIALVLTVSAMVAALLILVASPAVARDRVDRFNDNGVIFVNDDNNNDDDFEDFFDNGFRDRFFFDGFADGENEFDQEAESGDVDLEFSTENTGDNSDVCAPALQFGNTGNVQNEQGGTQFFSDADDFEFDAEDQFVFEPSNETTCDQAVEQSSAASSN